MTDLIKVDKALRAHAAIEQAIQSLQATIAAKVELLSMQATLLEDYLASVLSDEIPKITTPAGVVERVPVTHYNVAEWETFLAAQFSAALVSLPWADELDDAQLGDIVTVLVAAGPTTMIKRDVKSTSVEAYVKQHKQPPRGIKAFSATKLKIKHTKPRAYDNE